MQAVASGCRSQTRVPHSPGPPTDGAHRRPSAGSTSSTCECSCIAGITITVEPFTICDRPAGRAMPFDTNRWSACQSPATGNTLAGLLPVVGPPPRARAPSMMPANDCAHEPIARWSRVFTCQNIHGWMSPSVPRPFSTPYSVMISEAFPPPSVILTMRAPASICRRPMPTTETWSCKGKNPTVRKSAIPGMVSFRRPA